MEKQQLTVIDVCSSRQIFDSFSDEWSSQRSYCLAVGVSGLESAADTDQLSFQVDNRVVMGVAVCWLPLTSFYISLQSDDVQDVSSSPNKPCAASDKSISVAEKTALIKKMLSKPSSKVTILECRTQLSTVYQALGQMAKCELSDPLVASWLLNPTAQTPTLNRLVLENCPEMSQLLSSSSGYGSVACNPGGTQSARTRAVVEVAIVSIVETRLKEQLDRAGLLEHYTKVEMKSVSNCQDKLSEWKRANPPPTFIGFKTAAGNSIQISMEAMEKAGALMTSTEKSSDIIDSEEDEEIMSIFNAC